MRSCWNIANGRARVDWQCQGAKSPSGGTFAELDQDHCTATSGPEAGTNFCPGQVIERNRCPSSRDYYICPNNQDKGASFVSHSTLSCNVEAKEWEPLHRGIHLQHWTATGRRFRALRARACWRQSMEDFILRSTSPMAAWPSVENPSGPHRPIPTIEVSSPLATMQMASAWPTTWKSPLPKPPMDGRSCMRRCDLGIWRHTDWQQLNIGTGSNRSWAECRRENIVPAHGRREGVQGHDRCPIWGGAGQLGCPCRNQPRWRWFNHHVDATAWGGQCSNSRLPAGGRQFTIVPRSSGFF